MIKILFLVILISSTVQAKVEIPDLEVTIQTGENKLFYSDLVKDKVVVIQFIFTNCGMVCPVLGALFSRLQKRLGPQMGQQIHLLSISIDPANDTPEKMRLWAKKFDAGFGWNQITGKKQIIDQLLKSLQAFSADRDSHSALLLLGNERVGVWKRLDGTTPLKILETEIQKLLVLNN